MELLVIGKRERLEFGVLIFIDLKEVDEESVERERIERERVNLVMFKKLLEEEWVVC